MTNITYDRRIIMDMVRDFAVHDKRMDVFLRGHFKYDDGPQLNQYLMMKIEEYRPRMLVLNFSNVTFVDSQGLGLLFSLFKFCQQCDCSLVVRRPSPFVRNLLQLTRIDTLITVDEV